MNTSNLLEKSLAASKKAANKTKITRKGNLTLKEMRKIMNKITVVLIVALTVLAAGCSKTKPAENNHLVIEGSGKLVSRQMDFSGFDKVEAGLNFGLTIRHGDDFKITLTSDDNFIDYILVELVGTTLRIDYKPGYAYNVRGVAKHIEVTMPDLAGLSLGESSHTWLVGARSAQTFKAELTGSSMLEGDLQAADASFILSGSTYVNLTGAAEQLKLESCGNSVANLENFTAGNAFLEVSCNSISSVRVDGNLDIDASQYAQVFFWGEPESVNNAIFESAFVEKK